MNGLPGLSRCRNPPPPDDGPGGSGPKQGQVALSWETTITPIERKGEDMSEKVKQAGEALMEAFNNLPDSKKEFLLGYAEGVAAVTKKSAETPDTATAK